VNANSSLSHHQSESVAAAASQWLPWLAEDCLWCWVQRVSYS